MVLDGLRQSRETGGWAAVERDLDGLAAEGVDVAGVPFRLLDDDLSLGRRDNAGSMSALARFLKGGQPEVFRAICADLDGSGTEALEAVVAQGQLHPKTRWEAICWAVFLRSWSLPNDEGPPARRIGTYWDSPDAPVDLVSPMGEWAALSSAWRCFSDVHAARFIGRVAGANAARIYSALWHPAAKSDLFRLYWLLDGGGVYVDADSRPGRGAGAFLNQIGVTPWALAMTRLPHAVTVNGFLSAQRGAPLIAGLVERVERNLRDNPEGPIFWLSGPGALTTHLWETREAIRVLPQGWWKANLFGQVDAAYKSTPANWRVHESAKGLKDIDWLSNYLPRRKRG